MSSQRKPRISENSTDVTGYFNPNQWPVTISISALGRTINVGSGKFVVDDHGRKVNDPILESYVGPAQLSREWSAAPVVLNRIAPVISQVPDMSTSPVRAATSFDRDVHGNVVARRMDTPGPIQPASAAGPVRAMSIEAALRAGLIRPTIRVNEDAPKDNAGTPVNGGLVPEIGFARDARPNELRKNVPITVPIEAVDEAEAPGTASTEPVKVPRGAIGAALDAASRLVNSILPQSEIPAAVVSSSSAPVISQLEERSSVPQQLPPPQLPQPDLGTGSDSGAAEEDQYVCAADGKKFRFRSHLKRHVQRKFPNRYDELMAPYPESAKSAPQPDQQAQEPAVAS